MDSPRWSALKQELTDIEEGFHPSFIVDNASYMIHWHSENKFTLKDGRSNHFHLSIEKWRRLRISYRRIPEEVKFTDDFRALPQGKGHYDILSNITDETRSNLRDIKFICRKNLMIRNKYTNESNVPILHSVSFYDYPQELQSYLLKLRRDNSQFEWENVCRDFDMEKLTPEDCALYIRHFYYSTIYGYPHLKKEINSDDILYVPVFEIS